MDTTNLVQAMVSGLLLGLPYGLIAMGLSIIWGVMNIVNFAHGEFLMVSMYITLGLYTFWHFSPVMSIPVSAVILFGTGWLVYRYIVSKVMSGPMLAQVVVTFGLSAFLQGLFLFLFTGNYRTVKVSGILSQSTNIHGVYVSYPQVIASLITIVVTLFLSWFMKNTMTGRAIMATEIDRETAKLMGIDTEKVNALSFGIGLACVGIAGAILSSYYYISPYVGLLFGLMSFVIVALGGFGSITGAVIAAIIIGEVESLGGVLVGPAYKYALVFSLYLIVIFIKPRGFFGW
ncbi:MAG: branched-chain amino acid ABC transporter permease [Synergistetes bacterium]|nr:branched-chain amino acid ABC transporter permease [Synergistota bacterium]